MSDRSAVSLDGAAQIVRHFGVAGLPTVLWTVIVCTALLKGDRGTIEYLWPYLFKTWLGLLVVWVFAIAWAAVQAARREAHSGVKVPSIDKAASAEPEASPAPAWPPAEPD